MELGGLTIQQAGRMHTSIKEHEYKVKFGDYRCRYCHKDFQHKGTMEAHVRDSSPKRPGAKEEGEKYECPEEGCSIRLTNKKSISKHLKNFHPDDQ